MTEKFPELGDLFEQRYELLELLGSGGVGTVFKARQTESARLIALKVLRPPNAIDDEFKQRFLREAQALNKLCHENIVTVYHLGLSENALPYLAMELVSGVSLRKELLDTGRLPVNRVLKIMKQLCSALSCMHESGIIHRDLKPENIMLLQKPEADTVKIIDFGLVKINTGSEQKLTATGLLIGSVNYMSPEQCRGKEADTRSDIYSMGICMYEMLAGEPPFNSDNPVGLMYKHVNLQVPELRLQNGKPIQLAISKFINKALEKDPDLRFQTAAEMQGELLHLDQGLEGQIPGAAISSRRLAPMPLVIALALLIPVFLAVIVLFTTKHHGSELPRQETRTRSSFEEREYVRYLEKLQKRYGTDSPETLRGLDRLESCYANQSKYAEAEAILRRSLAIKVKMLGQDDLQVAESLRKLSACCFRQGKYVEAEPLLKRVITTGEKLSEPNDWLANDLKLLAECYVCQAKYAEAEPFFRRSLAIRKGTDPSLSAFRALTVDKEAQKTLAIELADCLSHLGKQSEAEAILKQTAPIESKSTQ